MKKPKLSLFIFFLLFAVTLLSSLSINGETKRDVEINSANQSYDLFVSSVTNETTLYVQLNSEYLDFKVGVNYWGNELGGLYKGLVISLIFDTNDTELISWLISYEDSEEHYFTSDCEITGILRIRFTSLNLEDIGFSLIIDEKFTLWTYELVTKPIFDVFFGIERADGYPEIEKIFLELDQRFLSEINFTVGVYDEYNETLSILEGFYYSHLDTGVTLSAYLIEDYWYRLSFEFENFNSSSWISIKLYYDHMDTEYIARLFLNKGDNDLSEIPIDYVHSSYEYWWYIDYYYAQGPDYPFFMSIVIVLLKYVLYGAIIFVVITIVFRTVIRRKRKKATTDFNPSQKYNYVNDNISYQPQETVAINFDDKVDNYSLKTPEKSKVKCSICLQIINDHKKLIRCPSCDIAYHKNHLYQWIVGNGTCPACKSRLRITQK